MYCIIEYKRNAFWGDKFVYMGRTHLLPQMFVCNPPIQRNVCSAHIRLHSYTIPIYFIFFLIPHFFRKHFFCFIFDLTCFHILTLVQRLLFVYFIILFKFFAQICGFNILRISVLFSFSFFFCWLLLCFGYNFPLFVNKISNFADSLFMFRMKAMATGCLSMPRWSRDGAARLCIAVP